MTVSREKREILLENACRDNLSVGGRRKNCRNLESRVTRDRLTGYDKRISLCESRETLAISQRNGDGRGKN